MTDEPNRPHAMLTDQQVTTVVSGFVAFGDAIAGAIRGEFGHVRAALEGLREEIRGGFREVLDAIEAIESHSADQR